ncbi:hypothetical protein ES703_114818 [subsurface metagenome]
MVNYLYCLANSLRRADYYFNLTLYSQRDCIYCDNIKRVSHRNDNTVICLTDNHKAKSFGDTLRQYSGQVHIYLVNIIEARILQ